MIQNWERKIQELRNKGEFPGEIVEMIRKAERSAYVTCLRKPLDLSKPLQVYPMRMDYGVLKVLFCLRKLNDGGVSIVSDIIVKKKEG